MQRSDWRPRSSLATAASPRPSPSSASGPPRRRRRRSSGGSPSSRGRTPDSPFRAGPSYLRPRTGSDQSGSPALQRHLRTGDQFQSCRRPLKTSPPTARKRHHIERAQAAHRLGGRIVAAGGRRTRPDPDRPACPGYPGAPGGFVHPASAEHEWAVDGHCRTGDDRHLECRRPWVIDRWIDVPDALLQRYTTLGITLNMAGNTGRCGSSSHSPRPSTGTVWVESLPAVPPVPGGLQSIPQALMPRTLIGIGPDAYADTVRAVVSPSPATPQCTADRHRGDQCGRGPSANGPAVIVAADGWDHPETPLPVDAEGARSPSTVFCRTEAHHIDPRSAIGIRIAAGLLRRPALAVGGHLQCRAGATGCLVALG